MHAFTASLPEYHRLPGVSPAANTALVLCGFHPAHKSYYLLVRGVPSALGEAADIHRTGLNFAGLLRACDGLRLGLPAGLSQALYRDGRPVAAGESRPWQQFYWAEQGPELRGVLDPEQDEELAGVMLPLFFSTTTAQ